MLKKFFIIFLAMGLALCSFLAAEDTNKLSEDKIIYVTMGTSKLVKLDFDVKNIAIGNPDIADVLINSRRELLINGKGAGITSLSVWDTIRNYSYKIAVIKSSEDITFRLYKLHNVALVQNKIENYDNMLEVEREPVKETIKNLENILGGYLNPNQYAVNPWTNSIMVVGSNKDHEKISELVAQLDARRKQVLFKIEIYELKLEDTLTNELQLLYQKGEGTVEYKKSTSGLTYTYSSGAEFAESATHVLKSLETKGRAKILANPHILSLDERYSVIHSGKKIPLVKYDAQGNPTVEYLYTGVMFGIIPTVDDESGYINCWLFTGAGSIAGYDPQNGYPYLAARETIHDVRVKDNGMLVLGGLLQETKNENYYKIPVLGDLLGWIPIIGSFVKNEASEKINTELVITIRPHIVFDDEELIAKEQ